MRLARWILPCFTVLIAAAAEPALPETPAGKVLRAWLDAFNSGDHARIEAYLAKYSPEKKAEADRMSGLREMTGGFELLAIEKSEPQEIGFRVKERKSATQG